MITSKQNAKIKRIRLLQAQSKSRKEQKAFVIEGIRLLEEASINKHKPEYLIFTQDLDSRAKQLLEVFQELNVPCEEVTPEVLKAASDTETPQGLLAVMPQCSIALSDEKDFLVIADEIRDPGNLGTIMRTALAAGVQGILLAPGTVDPFSPKVVRSGMGVHFQLPIQYCSWEEIRLVVNGLRVYTADMTRGNSLWDTDLTKPLALLIGGEAFGPSEKSLDITGEFIHIPMAAEVESLNAASAGTILIYEVFRQRLRQK